MKRTLGLLLIIALAALGVILSLGSRTETSAAAVTFTKDVAPIIQKNCTVCHRPGEVAPMSFTNYREIRPWAKAIREKVASRAMQVTSAPAFQSAAARKPPTAPGPRTATDGALMRDGARDGPGGPPRSPGRPSRAPTAPRSVRCARRARA